jgi:uncharacterized protein
MKSYVAISGATGGLGKAFAAECAARGWDLLLTDLSEERLAHLATGLDRLYGINTLTQVCDLTDAADREKLWRFVDQRGVRLHFLINVAGLDYQGPFEERRVDELQTMVRLNIESTLEMTRRGLAFRDPHRTFHVVNVSSLAAFYPMPVKAVYAASKRFLLDWSRALAEELRDQDVTVTALCPAGMPTTEACIRSIDAQGFMGRLTTMNTGDVAAVTIRRALVGWRVVIPGTINQTLRFLGGMMPAPWVAHLISKRWKIAHAKSHASVAGMTPSMAHN